MDRHQVYSRSCATNKASAAEIDVQQQGRYQSMIPYERRNKEVRIYITHVGKNNVTPTSFARSACSCQTIGRGNANITTSETKFGRLLPERRGGLHISTEGATEAIAFAVRKAIRKYVIVRAVATSGDSSLIYSKRRTIPD